MFVFKLVNIHLLEHIVLDEKSSSKPPDYQLFRMWRVSFTGSNGVNAVILRVVYKMADLEKHAAPKVPASPAMLAEFQGGHEQDKPQGQTERLLGEGGKNQYYQEQPSLCVSVDNTD